MTTPVPTPAQKALKRVLAISAVDGWSFVIIAALSLVITLAFLNPIGIFVSLMVLIAGVMELRGRNKLKRRDPAGMQLLVRSQLFLLAVILVYCARCLGSFDGDYIKDLIPEIRQWMLMLSVNLDDVLRDVGLTTDELVPLTRKMFVLLYGTFALVTLFYQGGMALYYRAKTPLVTDALSAPPPALPPNRPLA